MSLLVALSLTYCALVVVSIFVLGGTLSEQERRRDDGLADETDDTLAGNDRAALRGGQIGDRAMSKGKPAHRRQPTLATLEAQVAAWNARIKVGDRVCYTSHPGAAGQYFETRSEASILSGHTAVVWLAGKSGCVAIGHCAPTGDGPAE